MNKILFILVAILLAWFAISLYYDKWTDYFAIPVLIAIVAGLFTNYLHEVFEQRKQLERFNRTLGHVVGEYDVYHWRDLSKPDGCNYKINISLDKKTGILTVRQSGRYPYDILEAEIKMDEPSLNYREGIYVHPQKDKNPFGRMQLYLMNNNTINVDKTYLDIKGDGTFIPSAEKWQWRKS